MTDRSRNPSCS